MDTDRKYPVHSMNERAEVVAKYLKLVKIAPLCAHNIKKRLQNGEQWSE